MLLIFITMSRWIILPWKYLVNKSIYLLKNIKKDNQNNLLHPIDIHNNEEINPFDLESI